VPASAPVQLAWRFQDPILGLRALRALRVKPPWFEILLATPQAFGYFALRMNRTTIKRTIKTWTLFAGHQGCRRA